jgi:hypothetical protein
MITPLPHSLATRPDESLLGFLLRLAHRLDTSPLRVAQGTGPGPSERVVKRACVPPGRS